MQCIVLLVERALRSPQQRASAIADQTREKQQQHCTPDLSRILLGSRSRDGLHHHQHIKRRRMKAGSKKVYCSSDC